MKVPMMRLATMASVVTLTMTGLAAGNAAMAQSTTIRLGHYFATEDFRGKTAQHFADRVEELTDTINVEVFPAESLVKGREGLQATAQGTVDMYSIYVGYITGQAPLLNIFTLPFPPETYTDDAQAAFAADPEVAEVIDRSLNRFGVRVMGVINSSGPSHMFMREPVESMDDLDGRKVRGAGGLSDEALEELGMSVVFMSAAEQFLALQTGTVDGISTTWSSYVNNNLADVGPHHIDTTLVRSPYLLMMNARKWQSLTPEQQEALTQATADTMEWSTENFQEEQDELYEKMTELAETNDPIPAEDMEKIREMVKPIYEGYVEDNGEDGAKLMEIWERYAYGE